MKTLALVLASASLAACSAQSADARFGPGGELDKKIEEIEARLAAHDGRLGLLDAKVLLPVVTYVVAAPNTYTTDQAGCPSASSGGNASAYFAAAECRNVQNVSCDGIFNQSGRFETVGYQVASGTQIRGIYCRLLK